MTRCHEAVSTICLFNTEVINVLGSWKFVRRVEWETLKWVNRYNTQRRYCATGYFKLLVFEPAAFLIDHWPNCFSPKCKTT